MSNSEIPDYIGALSGEDEEEYTEKTQPQPDGGDCGVWAAALLLCLVVIPALVASVFVWSVG